MTKWWHVSWTRLGKAILVVFGVLWLIAGIGLLGFYQLTPWLTARDLYRGPNSLNDPASFNQIPASLPNKEVTPLSGVHIESYGFGFRVPWNETPLERKERGVTALAYLRSGTGMLIIDPASLLDSAHSIRSIAKANKIRDLERPISNYDLMAEAMASTPDQVKWWQTPTRNARTLTLLELKGTTLRSFGALYRIDFGNWRGFQEGDPSIAPYKVQLNLFDSADQHLEVLISGKQGSGPVISQAEVNAIVASIEPISPN